MKLNQLNLIVRDMPASVAFYRLLGLVVDDQKPFAAHHLAIRFPSGLLLELDSEAFVRKWNPGWRGGPGGRNVVGFETSTRAEVDEIHARVTAAGHRSQCAPHDAFWGARYAVVEDPDGNPIGLMSPVDPSKNSPPPQW